MTRVPIACTLSAGALADRVEEWALAFSTSVERTILDGNRATLQLRPGCEVLVTMADLAAREKACCAFFEFSIRLDADDAQLQIWVPPEAQQVLRDLMSLSSPVVGSN